VTQKATTHQHPYCHPPANIQPNAAGSSGASKGQEKLNKMAFATLNLSAGLAIEWISKQMGHIEIDRGAEQSGRRDSNSGPLADPRLKRQGCS
jgi:hypothetical protein